MINPLKYRVLIAGILSIPAAAYLGIQTYARLTRASADVSQDFVFRLTMVTLAMAAPFIVTLVLALADRRKGRLGLAAKAGTTLAVISLCLTIVPLRGLVRRVQQARTVSAQGVPAPLFETADLDGKIHRLRDHQGKVVLINAWATWCGPCREEMPALDRLYRQRKDEGFVVFGLSIEDHELQRKFVKEKVAVTYPLLTLNGDVPSLYKDIQRWPALFLIDRLGELQPVAQGGAHFEQVEATVESLLKR
jgi:thiol-disulfide isomerase/thioredoxin